MFILTVPPDDDFAPKARLDGEKIDTAIPKSSQKVELDLDDSPFLEEEEEVEASAPRQEISVEEIPLDAPAPATSKKKVALIGIVVGVLLLAVIVIALLNLRKRTPAQFKEPTPTVEPLAPAEPKEAPPPLPQEQMIALSPFTIEFPDKEKTRFLTCKFVLVTDNQELVREVDDKMLFIRDGVYYFLKNKSVAYLSDRANADNLKSSLLIVVNQYLSTGQVKTIWIEDYLVK